MTFSIVKNFFYSLHMLLTTEVAEIAEESHALIYKTEQLKQNGMPEDEAYIIAKDEIRDRNTVNKK
ncbi:hypothetical protein [Bacillus toyonensis]|nr:hypothetical protein [Bacillus toyonensis]